MPAERKIRLLLIHSFIDSAFVPGTLGLILVSVVSFSLALRSSISFLDSCSTSESRREYYLLEICKVSLSGDKLQEMLSSFYRSYESVVITLLGI